MKMVIYLWVAMLLLSCHRDELMGFQQEKSSVYFYLNKNVTQNKIVKSFTSTLEDRLMVNVPVCCSGVAANNERNFRLIVVTEGTTAQADIDYEALAEEYIFPADTNQVQVPVVLKRTELLEDSTLVLRLTLEESDDFAIGEKLRQIIEINFSDRLEKPDNWSKNYGTYSRVKHRIFLMLTKRDTYPTSEEWNADKYYFALVVQRALSGYFRDNYPVKDENDNIINPW